MSPRFQWISSNSSRKSLDVRSIFSDFAIRVEREELSDVVWRMSSAILARTISELYQRKIEFTDVLFYQLIQ